MTREEFRLRSCFFAVLLRSDGSRFTDTMRGFESAPRGCPARAGVVCTRQIGICEVTALLRILRSFQPAATLAGATARSQAALSCCSPKVAGGESGEGAPLWCAVMVLVNNSNIIRLLTLPVRPDPLRFRIGSGQPRRGHQGASYRVRGKEAGCLDGTLRESRGRCQGRKYLYG